MRDYSEDYAMITAWQQHGDVESRNRLVMRHLPFAVGIARRAAMKNAADAADADQAGMIGLMQAADKFRVSSGRSFLTCAAFWIRKEVIEELFRGSRGLAVPAGSRYRAKRENWDPGHALDEPVTPGGLTLADLVADPAQPADERAAERQLRSMAGSALSRLDPRRRVIVTRRSQGETLASIARDLGCGRERARQLYVDSLRKMRRSMGVELEPRDGGSGRQDAAMGINQLEPGIPEERQS